MRPRQTTEPAGVAAVLPKRIGILAGGGRLPSLIADSVIAQGGSVHIVGVEGEADQSITAYPHTWVNWGQVGRMLRTLRTEGGGQMVIAGSVTRPILSQLRPDLGFFRVLPQVLRMLVGGDDSVLTRVVRVFELNGVTVRDGQTIGLINDKLAVAGEMPLDTLLSIAASRLGMPALAFVLGQAQIRTFSELVVGPLSRMSASQRENLRMELLARLAAFIPKPRVNLLLYHGVFAPHARRRSGALSARRADAGGVGGGGTTEPAPVASTDGAAEEPARHRAQGRETQTRREKGEGHNPSRRAQKDDRCGGRGHDGKTE